MLVVLVLLVVLADAPARPVCSCDGWSAGLLFDRLTNLVYQVTIRRLTW
jgi:hypothetical protein